jgi:hypothetical protein
MNIKRPVAWIYTVVMVHNVVLRALQRFVDGRCCCAAPTRQQYASVRPRYWTCMRYCSATLLQLDTCFNQTLVTHQQTDYTHQ